MRPLKLLSLEPEALVFDRGGSGAEERVSSTLRILNRSEGSAAWKVRTTAPEACLVAPRSGVLGPSESAEATITLLPDPLIAELRFEVRAAAVPAERGEVSRAEWALIPQSELQGARLRGVVRAPKRAPAAAGADGADELRHGASEASSRAGAAGRGFGQEAGLDRGGADLLDDGRPIAAPEDGAGRWVPGRAPRAHGFGKDSGGWPPADGEGPRSRQAAARRSADGPPRSGPATAGHSGGGGAAPKAKAAAADGPPQMGAGTKAVLAVLMSILAYNLYIRPYLDWQ